MALKNTKNVPRYIFGSGSFSQLPDILDEIRKRDEKVVFYVDHFFKGKNLPGKLPAGPQDIVEFIDTTDEPTTTLIDELAAKTEMPIACVVGIGGGAVLDIAKAVSNLLTNGGKAEQYQGWDLVKKPGVFKIGIPTLSGTGSEASRTCVLTNEVRGIKLGMNSDFSIYDQLILDPDLTATVPRDQYFYTGMDTYLHCMESLRGSYRNVVVDALSEKAMEMCQDIFLSDDMMSPKNREKMMIASYFGGCAAGNVGVVHPLSAGLSIALHLHHCVANCITMNVLEEFYSKEHEEFRQMVDKQKVNIPANVCKDRAPDIFEKLYASSIIHEKPLTNALGPDFKKVLTKEKMISLFKRM
jgi:3-deoxy-alpha-D-manno-octulosonate 8-oxidase